MQETLGDGTATIAFQTQHGVHYDVQHGTRGSASPVVRGSDGRDCPMSRLDGDLFRTEAYAQNEIEGIACSPKAQLDLIDGFAEGDIQPPRSERAADRPEARADRGGPPPARRGDHRRRAACEAELPSVTEALKGIDLGASGSQNPDHERVRAHEAKVQRGREQAAMSALSVELGMSGVVLDAFARDAVQRPGRAVEGDLERGAHGEIFSIRARACRGSPAP